MFRRPAVSWLLACALASGTSAGWAQAIVKRIVDRQFVTIGYTENAAPFSFARGGEPAGYAIALCGAVADRMRRDLQQAGLRIRFVPVDQDNVARLMRSGSVDLLCGGISDTPARRRTMLFSPPIFLSSVKLLVRAEGGPQALSGLAGKTVAVIGRTTAEDAINDLNKRGLRVGMSRVVSPDAALSQLRLKQADAWARDEVLILGTLAGEADAQKFTLLQDALSQEVIAIAMPLDEQLRRIVADTLSDLARSGQLEALYDKWFVQPNAGSATGLKLPLSPELKAEFDRLR